MTFRLGRLLATPGALDAINPDDLFTILQRHAMGDWGDEERQANERALRAPIVRLRCEGRDGLDHHPGGPPPRSRLLR